MQTRALGDEDRRRLAEARTEADRRYNDALTALDAALRQAGVDLPAPPPPLDDRVVSDLNERWAIALNAPPLPGGWRGRAARFVWRIVAPFFDRQQQFNSALVDHLNRNVAGERQGREALTHALTLLRAELDALTTFESRLVQFLQHITAYVDTRDRDVAAAALAAPDERARGLEQTIGLVQQQVAALKRELDRLLIAPTGASPAATTAPVQRAGGFSALDAYKYVGFEGEFRGSEEAIAARLDRYASLFAGASDVLDVGCGRGEFLETLRARRIRARGVELNHEMAEACRGRGLDVEEGDGVGVLERLPDGALGGLFAAQVVEHLEPAYLLRFLELAYHKLRPGSKIVLETINVDCWSAFFGPYLRDITHVRPLPPETLGFLLRASGFQRVETRAASPVDESVKLRRIAAVGLSDASVRALVEAFNQNVDALNGLLFTHLDYAAIGERL